MAGGNMPKNLIEELEELRLLLEKAQTERYVWFCTQSESGKDCAYAMNAKQLFEDEYSEEIESKISYIKNTFYKE